MLIRAVNDSEQLLPSGERLTGEVLPHGHQCRNDCPHPCDRRDRAPGTPRL